MGAGAWRGVQFVEYINGEVGAAQDLDPFAVTWVELSPVTERSQTGDIALGAQQLVSGVSCRAGLAQGQQNARGNGIPIARGRRSHAASGTQRAGSHHRLAPHSEITRSRQRPGSETCPASASRSGNESLKCSWQWRAVASRAAVRSMPTGCAPRLAGHAEKYAVPHLNSTTSWPATSHRTLSLFLGS